MNEPLNDTDQYWMQQAIALAQQAAKQGEVPVGALLVADNQCLARGFNQPIACHDASAHAEIMALRQAGEQRANYRLLNSTLYVTLEPCLMCVGAMIHARIARVVFGAYDEKTGALGSWLNVMALTGHNHYFTVTGGVCAAQCSQLLSQFFAQRRAQKKSEKQAK